MPIIDSTFRTLDDFPQKPNVTRAQEIIDRFKDRLENGFSLVDLPTDGDRIIRPESDTDLKLSSELPVDSFGSDIAYICDRIDLMIADIRGQLGDRLKDTSFHSISIHCSEYNVGDDDPSEIDFLAPDPTVGFHTDFGPERILLAFGDVAQTECVLGAIEVDSLDDNWKEQDDVIDQTTRKAVHDGFASIHSIPNGIPVLMNEDTIHHRGRILCKGFRLLLVLRFKEA